MPFSRPNLKEIIERVETDITSRTSENEYPQVGSVAGVFAAALGGASHLLHAHLDWGIKQMLPSTATGEQLEEHARIWLKVPRKQCTCRQHYTGRTRHRDFTFGKRRRFTRYF